MDNKLRNTFKVKYYKGDNEIVDYLTVKYSPITKSYITIKNHLNDEPNKNKKIKMEKDNE